MYKSNIVDMYNYNAHFIPFKGPHQSIALEMLDKFLFWSAAKRRASWGQCAHEIEKSQGSGDFDIEFAIDFETRLHARARREVVFDGMR